MSLSTSSCQTIGDSIDRVSGSTEAFYIEFYIFLQATFNSEREERFESSCICIMKKKRSKTRVVTSAFIILIKLNKYLRISLLEILSAAFDFPSWYTCHCREGNSWTLLDVTMIYSVHSFEWFFFLYWFSLAMFEFIRWYNSFIEFIISTLRYCDSTEAQQAYLKLKLNSLHKVTNTVFSRCVIYVTKKTFRQSENKKKVF